ncbi:MAG TPA: sigma-70 family RNA polymerase sigma factor [Planctomycetota bacterium]|nr:sigma-70 family RNA polymerase sigma factor [Planctomycetota bacterium]
MSDDYTQLYERANEGDEEALDHLLQRYLPQLHAFVHARLGPDLRARESSLDVVQSVCRELLSERGRFDFRGEERFRSWIFVAALNKIRERHRRLRSDKRDPAHEAAIADSTTFAHLLHGRTPSQEAIGNEAALAVRDALDALSEEQREVITLARLAELPHKVIAEVMDRNEAATRQLLARAMVEFVLALRRRGIDVSRWTVQ